MTVQEHAKLQDAVSEARNRIEHLTRELAEVKARLHSVELQGRERLSDLLRLTNLFSGINDRFDRLERKVKP